MEGESRGSVQFVLVRCGAGGTIRCDSISLARLFFLLVGLVEEEVRRQLFVLVAGEVSLDDGVAGETETAELEGAVSMWQ